MARRNKIKPKVGDVFTFSIDGTRNCFGQIVAPQVKQYGEKLYVLFDYTAAAEHMNHFDIDAIAVQPILAIARMDDFCIEDGEWRIVGNTQIYHAHRIVLPHYIIGDSTVGESVVVVKSYDGKTIRIATDEEVNEALHGHPKLGFWDSVTPNTFEAIAKDTFVEKSETDIFELPFVGSKWDASANTEGMPLKDLLMRDIEDLIAMEEFTMVKGTPEGMFLSYFWAEPEKVFIREGIVGQESQLYEVDLNADNTANDVMKRIEKTLLEQRFDYIDSDYYTNVAVRLALSSEGFGTEDDLEKKNRIEYLLNTCLQLTGNGGCDGSEIGNGEMLIFCYVIDKEKAMETIKLELQKHDLLEGAEITCSQR